LSQWQPCNNQILAPDEVNSDENVKDKVFENSPIFIEPEVINCFSEPQKFFDETKRGLRLIAL